MKKSKVKAVIPIHLYGQCADMESILDVARTYGLTVIEDAAQAIGAEYAFGNGTVRRAGSMGDFGCFSFFPSKNLGAFGDGGMVTTDDKGLYEGLKVMRVHGSKPKYYHSVIGGNFRLDALQAAVLMVKLKYLDEWTKARQKNADLYRSFFQEEGINEISLPKAGENRHIYNQFVIKVREQRDRLKEFLYRQGIGCEIYYPLPLHMQACFSYLGYKPEAFPVSVTAADTTLALPIYPELTKDQISYVVEMICKFFKKKG
jgi:dTDP-4-amino-4,6-dideoxygalactose transaminase